MSALVWIMMGIAIWHFAVWIPDRFWGGIVGALLAAIAGAFLFGLIVSGFNIPGESDTTIAASLEAIPGSIIGLALSYWYGALREGRAGPREQRA
jgi:uncharacterized membrane protein YeaQ/YmgE (transglycosylase-associated protein family)